MIGEERSEACSGRLKRSKMNQNKNKDDSVGRKGKQSNAIDLKTEATNQKKEEMLMKIVIITLNHCSASPNSKTLPPVVPTSHNNVSRSSAVY